MQVHRIFFLLTLIMFTGINVSPLGAHCQVPCGIYNDQMRIDMIAEHATTIEKAMQMIVKLSGSDTLQDRNQVTRWVMNKESHAEELERIIWHYFMAQRIKPEAEKYTEKITVLHKMLLATMRCKQTVDLANVEVLRELLKQFETLYFSHSHKS